jgi:hypothetical protein
MQAPINIKQLFPFIWAVTYYHNMWPFHSHILAPLTDLTSNSTFHLTPSHLKELMQ